MNEHYKKHHRGKPHESVVNGVWPLSQQRTPAKNETAYIFLYIAIGVGAFLLAIMAYGVYRDHRNKSKARNIEKKERLRKLSIYPDVKPMGGSVKSGATNLYTTGTTSTGESVPSMSTITEEVQPPAKDVPYSSLLNNQPHTTNTQQQQREDFGRHNRHHSDHKAKAPSHLPTKYPDLKTEDQRQQNSSSNNLDSHTSFVPGYQFFHSASSAPTAPPTNSSASSSSHDSNNAPAGNSSNRRHLSREESFPYEKYGMPPEDREPRAARVENMRPLSDFLKLTPGDSFYRLDEEEDSGGSERDGGRAGHSSSSEGDHENGVHIVQLDEEDDNQEQQRFNNAVTLPFDKTKRGQNKNGN